MKSLGGDPQQDQPAGAGRPRHRPLGDGRRVRHAAGLRARTSSSNTSATASATSFLKWGQTAFDNFRVVPPGTGICHQVNLEYLAADRVDRQRPGRASESPIPTRSSAPISHTTMVNGLGVLGWGVGGIEAEAAMLGQPVSMLIPEVVGFKLTGKLTRGRHRDRPRAHRHPDAAQEGRGRQVRRVLRPRPRPT